MMGILFRVLVVLVLFCSVSGRVSAAVKTKIRPVTSPQNINLNPNKTCTDFTVTLDDNIDALTGSGTINAKLKINKKFLTTETSNFSIPYVDGAIGTSDSISVCLVDPDSITKTRKLPLTINIERKLAKKHKIKKLKTELAIYAGTVTISGKAIMPSSPLSQKNLRLKLQTTGDDSLTSSSTESDEELELELEEDIVIGATVELFEVDDEGQTIGEAIATTTTDVQGEFELEIPSDGGFDTDHVVNVSDGEEEVHSFVTEEEIIADPVSELIYENIQETATNDSVGSVDEVNRDVEIDDFNAEEVNSMREHIDELGVSFEEEGVSETVTSLESTIGGFVDNMIEVIMDEETDSEEENATEENQTEAAVNASGVAGDYFVAFFDAGISGYVSSDSDDGTASTQSAIELGTARLMKPSEAGVLHVVEVPKLNSQARLVRDNFSTTDGEDESNSGFLRLALSETEESDSSPSEDDERYDFSGDRLYILEANTDRENEGGNSSQEYFTSINSNNVINFVEPGREYSKVLPGGISGFREDPQVENFFPVGDGLFLSSSFGRGEMFSIVSGRTFSEDYYFGFGCLTQESEISDDDLNGNYGLVGIGLDFGAYGRLAISSLSGTFNVTSGLASANFEDLEVARNTEDALSFTIATNTYDASSCSDTNSATCEEESALISASQGKITFSMEELGDGEIFEGYARKDGDIIVFVSSQNHRDNDGEVGSANREIDIAVRLSATAPNLSGKNYTLLSYGAEFLDDGSIGMKSGSVGQLSFDGSIASFVGDNLNKVTRIGDEGVVSLTPATGLEASAEASIGDDGSISMVLGSASIKGYVSQDEKLIILQVFDANSISLYLAVAAGN